MQKHMMGSFRVFVQDQYGKPYKGVRVRGQWGFMSYTNDFYTDDSGWAYMEWSASSPLQALWIAGQEHPYKSFPNGGSVMVTVEKTVWGEGYLKV
jgi:hypothetical protein